MPAPNPSLVLDDPPSLTPPELRSFPYRLRPFPLDLLALPPAAVSAAPEPAVSDASLE